MLVCLDVLDEDGFYEVAYIPVLFVCDYFDVVEDQRADGAGDSYFLSVWFGDDGVHGFSTSKNLNISTTIYTFFHITCVLV